MKTISILLLLICSSTLAQSKFITKTGVINFEASVPSFEEVSATNESVTAIVNTENGEIAALALVKGFRFKNALMEEHFNENYAESDKFPKATFKGKLVDFSLEKNETTYLLNGEISFHGKTIAIQNVIVKASIHVDKIILTGEFITKASDFDIEIPKIVRNKITEDITITFQFEMIQK
ncbi:MAG: YceI family protein [Algicola sp.]|nr:YceI family protein [Algicola sp.]